MKKLWTAWITLALLALYTETVFAQTPADAPARSVCAEQPMRKPVIGECLRAGPTAYLAELAEQGLFLPQQPLPAQRLAPEYSVIDYQYMWVRDETNRVPVFSTLDEAVAGKSPASYLTTNFSYITYQDIVDVDGKRFVLTDSGMWVPRGNVSPVGVPGAQGLVFYGAPASDFGWIFDIVQPQRQPGYSNRDYLPKTFYPNQVVQVYESLVVDGAEWNRIGLESWVEGRVVNRVSLSSTPPEGVSNGRWIDVNLAEQTIAVYEQQRLVFATVMASGLEPLWTRPGLFPVREKYATTPMSGATLADRSDYYYLENVPWTLYFDGARALHGAYWRTKLGHPQSHGCVNMTVGDARWVFDWAQVGDWVHVWDPSGRTPTDPALYGEGGA